MAVGPEHHEPVVVERPLQSHQLAPHALVDLGDVVELGDVLVVDVGEVEVAVGLEGDVALLCRRVAHVADVEHAGDDGFLAGVGAGSRVDALHHHEHAERVERARQLERSVQVQLDDVGGVLQGGPPRGVSAKKPKENELSAVPPDDVLDERDLVGGVALHHGGDAGVVLLSEVLVAREPVPDQVVAAAKVVDVGVAERREPASVSDERESAPQLVEGVVRSSRRVEHLEVSAPVERVFVFLGVFRAWQRPGAVRESLDDLLKPRAVDEEPAVLALPHAGDVLQVRQTSRAFPVDAEFSAHHRRQRREPVGVDVEAVLLRQHAVRERPQVQRSESDR